MDLVCFPAEDRRTHGALQRLQHALKITLSGRQFFTAFTRYLRRLQRYMYLVHQIKQLVQTLAKAGAFGRGIILPELADRDGFR